MTPATRGSRRTHPLRLWWALPLTAVTGTAIGMAVVVGPTLGERVAIPHQLVLPVTTATTPPAPAPTNATKPAAHPSPPKPVVTSTSTPLPQTHVVPPRRPLVTASADDGYEHESGSDRSSVESNGTDR